MLLSINRHNPQVRLIEKVVNVLLKDGIIIYPSDTVYALGCSILSKKAMKRIYKIKKINHNKPLTMICANQKEVQEYTQGISNHIYKRLCIYIYILR